MEFKQTSGDFFKNEITIVTSNILEQFKVSRNYENIAMMINYAGMASAKAQSLKCVITSADRMKFSDHVLYVLKDCNALSGTTIIGILKVGIKKLFLHDKMGRTHELSPLCLLDFYVHESRQRLGCGRKLFDFMLRDQHKTALTLPIDKPSMKCKAFLRRHYGLQTLINQVNNYIVYEGFFSALTSESSRIQHQARLGSANTPRNFKKKQAKNVEIANKFNSRTENEDMKINYSPPLLQRTPACEIQEGQTGIDDSKSLSTTNQGNERTMDTTTTYEPSVRNTTPSRSQRLQQHQQQLLMNPTSAGNSPITKPVQPQHQDAQVHQAARPQNSRRGEREVHSSQAISRVSQPTTASIVAEPATTTASVGSGEEQSRAPIMQTSIYQLKKSSTVDQHLDFASPLQTKQNTEEFMASLKSVLPRSRSYGAGLKDGLNSEIGRYAHSTKYRKSTQPW